MNKNIRTLGLVLFVIALFAAACQPKDMAPPTVHFVSPQAGDSFPPGVYTLKAVATDDVGPTHVAFFVYTEMLGLVYDSKGDTFSVEVDCRTDTLTAYQLRAFAVDEADNQVMDSLTVYISR
jgi:hypothetical protein